MDGLIVVGDESVNRQGFRMLSGGGQFANFKKNPVMLYLHERNANGKAKLPIGRWEDLQVQADGRIIGRPIFNEGNPDGLAAKQSYDGGFLNAASLQADPIEWSEDPALMLAGQTLPTITKWELLEISLVDIPGNANAVRLKHHGKTIKLSNDDDSANHEELIKLFHPTKPDLSMKVIIATLNTMKLGFSLNEDAKEGEVLSAFQKVIASKDDAIATKEQSIVQLTAERDGLKLAKETAEADAAEKLALSLVEGAIASKKIQLAQKEQFLKLAKGDYASTKAVLDSMPGFTSVAGGLNKTGAVELSADDENAKRYDELFKSGKLAALKLSNVDEYKTLFKAKFGKDPK